MRMLEIKREGAPLIVTSDHLLQYNSKWNDGKTEEAPVYLSRNKMETIITQDSGMCLLVYHRPSTDRCTAGRIIQASARIQL